MKSAAQYAEEVASDSRSRSCRWFKSGLSHFLFSGIDTAPKPNHFSIKVYKQASIFDATKGVGKHQSNTYSGYSGCMSK